MEVRDSNKDKVEPFEQEKENLQRAVACLKGSALAD